MNKCLITYYLSLLAIAVTSCSFYAMEQEQQLTRFFNRSDHQKQLMQEKLVTIEEQLILKEIMNRGTHKVQIKLNDGIAIRKCYQDPTKPDKPVFIIRQTFFSTKIKKDSLTRSIFEAIDLRDEDHKSELPKQFLNNEIRYYVIKDKPAVLVIAKLTNEKKIQEIIDRHRPIIEIHKDGSLKRISIIDVSTVCALFICFLALFSQIQ